MQKQPLTLDSIQNETATIFSQYPLSRVAVFGSCARGEMNADSDVDFLVEFDHLESGLVFIEIKRRLERKLKRKVDLITYNSLQHSKYRDNILQEAKVIYEKNN